MATNIFPMAQEKLPTLEGLILPEEMLHVSAFPSVQRTILNGTLFPAIRGKAAAIQQVTMKRVMDNAPFTLNQEQFWVHLNYQLVHLLDFLPTVDWADNLDDPQFGLFLELRALLMDEGKLMATVDADVVDAGLKGVFIRPIAAVKQMLSVKTINQYSADVGHDLRFDIKFQNA
eukprot:TRINITY_DN5500_c0_g1_i7.p1 TRINITY_DN5500_c0_g1~~TRINITY_DN5500_c0_g1_i7.p1  ORF type:complete len:174 (-),score=57.60 TRINITY_DN5500_c0_g1_i7:26-547(-)